MDNNTFEIIKTIGSQWKFLLVIFFITIFIIKWKTIWSFASNFTQVRVKRGETEFELHRKGNKEENEIINQEKEKPKGESVEDDNEEIPKIKKDNNIHILYHEALRERKFKDAKDFFDKILEKEDNAKKRKEEIIRNYYWRHSYGDTSAFTELENYTSGIENDNEQKSVGLYYLSLIYKEANNYKKAVDLASKALELTTDNEQKSYCISRISEYHLDNDNQKESLEIIMKHIDSINEKGPKTSLYRTLANYYKKTDNKLLESVAYQKALELSPNNTYLLFDSAYNYSETKEDLKDLGLLLYKKLLGFNSKDPNALNNIGVAYKNLGLEINSVEHYKTAFELKNSLAASNIAYQLIHLGFVKEAQEYLDKAEEFENPHENVFKATSSIKSKIKEEKELEEKILKKANKKYRFFNHFGNAIFTSNTFKIKSSNKWQLNETPVTISLNNNIIELSWECGEEKHSLSGIITNNSIIATYKKPKKNIYSYNDQNKYIYRDTKGFGYLISSQEITFLFEFEKEIIELNFNEQ
jgi:hypothetical protein